MQLKTNAILQKPYLDESIVSLPKGKPVCTLVLLWFYAMILCYKNAKKNVTFK